MSRRQIIEQPEFPRGNNITTMVRNPGSGQSRQRHQYSYNRSQRSTRSSTRSSQLGNSSFQQFSQVDQHEVQYRTSASSSTTSTANIVVREHHREVVLVQNQPRRPEREIKHFSHRHPLQQHEIQDGDVMCEICQLDLQGPAYSCMECDYFLHKSCFDMPRQINHQAHRNHPLTLLSTPEYYQSGEFICNACRTLDSGFNYHCSTCNFDLHVVCASLPKTVNLDSDCYDYPLTLYYSFPFKNEAAMIVCHICSETVVKNSWVYYDRDSDFVSHVYCAFGEEDEEEVGNDAIVVIQNRLLGLEL